MTDFNLAGADAMEALMNAIATGATATGATAGDAIKLSTTTEQATTDRHNYCETCGVPMVPMASCSAEYKCTKCGRIAECDTNGNTEHEDNSGGGIRLARGGRNRYYNVGGNYSSVQRKTILDQLMRNNEIYPAKLPVSVLEVVATRYNQMQSLRVDDHDAAIPALKKFVKRGNVKDECLAALLYFECISSGITRKKKDIATFMRLPTSGFSHGESIVRDLHAEGKLSFPIPDEDSRGFADRYLEALGLEVPWYGEFVAKLVDISEAHRIGLNSQISSKVVGAIWYLNEHQRLGLTVQSIEKGTDNTKKNTFMKFYNIIKARQDVFKPIIDGYPAAKPAGPARPSGK